MENNTLTTKFLKLNFNLKKIIFSFLEIHDQRFIYWLSKDLRKLLPDSSLRININSLKKCCSYQFDDTLYGLLELNEGPISCWGNKKIGLLKFNKKSLEMTKSFPSKSNCDAPPIQQENGNIIYGRGNELTICDNNFNLIESIKESNLIITLCNISELSFAIGLWDRTIKIYSSNSNTQKYEVKEYKYHSYAVKSFLYLRKYKYLLSGSADKTINVLNLSVEKSIKTLTGHSSYVTSLISLSDETFASGSKGEIKIWSIKADKADIECIRSINAYVNGYISLHLLGNDIMVSRSGDEFKIWDVKNYECLNTYKEDSYIRRMIVTKNQNIITATNDNSVNIWQIKV
jgi:WD40 repeat protein